MSKLLSLSPEHFSAESLPAPGTGATVCLEMLDGKQLDGELRTFQADRQRCLIRAADARIDTSTPFARIRWLRFESPLESFRARRGEGELFEIQYQDQGRFRGSCYESRHDSSGLHLLAGQVDGGIRRLFVPLASVDHYRVGGFEGQGGPAPSASRAEPDANAPARNIQELLSRFASGRVGPPRGAERTFRQLEQSPGQAPRELALRLGLPFVDLREFDVDVHALSLVPEEFARTHRVLPLLFLHGRLVVAMGNPADPELLSMLHLVSGRSVDSVVAEDADLQGAIDRYYGVHEDSGTLDELETVAQRELEHNLPLQEVERLGKEKPVVRLVNSILLDAIHRGASDIHLRPGEKKVELLFRQDGTLVHVRDLAKMLLPAVVARLIEMGVESFLVKSSLLGVLAQRLVRLNCPHCKAQEPVDPLMRKALGAPNEETFHHATGCPECNQTGYHGRKAVYELLLLTPALRALLTPAVAAGTLREQAVRDGMVPLTTNAVELARTGTISLAEAYRVRLE